MIKCNAILHPFDRGTDKDSKQKTIFVFKRLCTIRACSIIFLPIDVRAQTIPDGSIPTTVEKLENILQINGGERAGDNLFHSFEEFSVPEGIEAIFENGLDIENIFTRITGDSSRAGYYKRFSRKSYRI